MVLRHGKNGRIRRVPANPTTPPKGDIAPPGKQRVAGHPFRRWLIAAEIPILAIDHVSADYPGKPKVIDDVSLEVRRGDTLAVVGKSGSGKSTLRAWSRAFCRATPAMSASTGVSLSPRLKDRAKDQLRRVQMIYQMPDVALNPQHTLLETIGQAGRFHFNRSRRGSSARVLSNC